MATNNMTNNLTCAELRFCVEPCPALSLNPPLLLSLCRPSVRRACKQLLKASFAQRLRIVSDFFASLGVKDDLGRVRTLILGRHDHFDFPLASATAILSTHLIALVNGISVLISLLLAGYVDPADLALVPHSACE